MPDDLATSATSETERGTNAGVTSANPPGYQLLDEVGHGGMGVVYRARDVALGRDVAIKLLAERYSLDSPAGQRFVDEARITGQLQHPGIPAVHQVGHLPDGRPFLAMKLIKGCTLEAVLKVGYEPSAERGRLLAVFEAVCQAVGYAHAHRVIHRDLKPSNIMLGAFGEVQVMDWGLAKVLGEEVTVPAESHSAEEITRPWTVVNPTPEADSQTQEGSLLGTPAFIPPEQAAGELTRVDERADVFGLGALLVVILTGKPPYVGANFESVRLMAVRGKLDDCLARLAVCGAEPELTSLCRKCLAFEPADRPRDAGEVAKAVAHLRSAAEERARTAEREQAAADVRAEEQRRKRQWQLATAGMVVVALVGGLVGLGAYLRSQERATVELQLKNSELVTAKEELESTLYFQRIALAHRELLENNLLHAEELLDQCPANHRAWEWYYLKRLCHVEPVTLRGQRGRAGTVAFSPDGRRIVSASEDNTLRIWDTTTGQGLLTFPDMGEVKCAAFRFPEGRLLFTGDKAGVTVWDTTTRKVVGPLGRHAAGVGSVASGPDGRLVASGEGKTVKVWNATTGELVHDLREHEGGSIQMVFSPDSQFLASGSYDTTVKIWDLSSGKSIRTLRGHIGPVCGVTFSADGQRLASASLDRTLKVWNLTTGQEILTLRGHSMEVNGVAFLDGGRRIASCSEDKTLKIWDATTGQVVLTLRGHTHELVGLVSTPDGQRLASVSGDKTVKLWDATPYEATVGQEVLTLRGHTEPILDLAFSPNGRRLCSASRDSTVRVWDAQTGREELCFSKHNRVAFSVAFSPDGQRIASGSVKLAPGEPSYLKVWDASNGQELLQPQGKYISAGSLTFSPGNGQWLVASTEGSDVCIWNAPTGELMHTLKQSPNVWGMSFSPDGRRLATLSREGIVTVHDATRWGEKALLNFRAHSVSVRGSLAYSPDSRRLVVPGDDNTINIWDMTINDKSPSAPQLTLRGHTAQVWGVAFSPDGRWVASGGEDNIMRIWDAKTGAQVHNFRGHSALVSRVVFSPDGKQLASASFDKTVKVWDLTGMHENAK